MVDRRYVVERTQSEVRVDEQPGDDPAWVRTCVVGYAPPVEFDFGLGAVENTAPHLWPRRRPGWLKHPPEWAELAEGGRLQQDGFTADRPDVVQNTGDVAITAATILTAAFVHEVMEWLAIDGQRVYDPHPSNGPHWEDIEESLGTMFDKLLQKWPDPGFDPHRIPEPAT